MPGLMQQRDPLASYRARPKAELKTIGAPIGGWNTTAALHNMPQTDAVVLDNLFPTVGSVDLRRGFASYATGVGAGAVETVIEYHSGATRKFLAAGDGAIYDISSAGAGSSLATGYANNRWQGVMFNTKLHMVNGADDPIAYDGSTISEPAWSGSGLTVTTLNGVCVYRERLFFWQAASQDFWYGGVQSVSGTLTKFPMSMLGKFGGNIVAMTPWARVVGDTTQEALAVVMSSGEVAIFVGTDPTSASDWLLQGVPKIGAPIAARGVYKLGNDVIVLTKDDWTSLVKAFGKDRVGTGKSSKISGAALAAARSYSSNFGWGICHYPAGNMLIINVPTSSTVFHQHVLNTVTGAWCRFTGMNGRCWATYNDELYFGGAGGVVYKADTGTDDNDDAIAAEAQTAWTHFGRQQPKMMVGVRPVISCTGSLTLTFGFGFDFKEVQVNQSASSASSGPLWDVALWDVEQWAPEANIRTDQYDASGEGTDISFRWRYSGEGQEIKWYRTDYWLIPGWAL